MKTLIKNYWNWRSASYNYDVNKSITIANTWESILRELTPDSTGKRALDIGTGTGDFAVYLARLGCKVTGIDISEAMIHRAEQNPLAQQHTIDFRPGDAEELLFDSETFDIVVSRNLLWTLPHPEKALKEWRRVLKPDGILVISDGLWLNITWKRLHHLVYKLLKGGGRNGSLASLRFFLTYAFIQNMLPFYEGLCFDKARILLQNARFNNIESYDASCFGMNPYAGKNYKNSCSPNFFI
ncbi:MAG: class I SAM-dependent methyltransferase, partial [Candidatus Latescibacteria bacterium]|nr:class I SAM-dependent methyltransferase [Candidatus Latescibacterota bacterium]